jgi:hypothetical protein
LRERKIGPRATGRTEGKIKWTLKPAPGKALSAFHRETKAFGELVPGTRTKYKILWFVVDLYHRQRYFFICGCKPTVTNLA